MKIYISYRQVIMLSKWSSIWQVCYTILIKSPDSLIINRYDIYCSINIQFLHTILITSCVDGQQDVGWCDSSAGFYQAELRFCFANVLSILGNICLPSRFKVIILITCHWQRLGPSLYTNALPCHSDPPYIGCTLRDILKNRKILWHKMPFVSSTSNQYWLHKLEIMYGFL